MQIRSPEPVEPIRPPWAPLMAERKKTPPSPLVRPRTPENFFRTESGSSTPVPGVPTAVEIIRNIKQSTSTTSSSQVTAPVVMMVARCQVKESTVYPRPLPHESSSSEAAGRRNSDNANMTRPLLPDPLGSAKAGDLGYEMSCNAVMASKSMKIYILICRYHSLDSPDGITETGSNITKQQKTIDETIARLNQTIEEIRSVDNVLLPESSGVPAGRRSGSWERETRFSPKREIVPSVNNAHESNPPLVGTTVTENNPTVRKLSAENRTSPVRTGLIRTVAENERHPSPSRSVPATQTTPTIPAVSHYRHETFHHSSANFVSSTCKNGLYFLLWEKSGKYGISQPLRLCFHSRVT